MCHSIAPLFGSVICHINWLSYKAMLCQLLKSLRVAMQRKSQFEQQRHVIKRQGHFTIRNNYSYSLAQTRPKNALHFSNYDPEG